jgi:hypothetical protein
MTPSTANASDSPGTALIAGAARLPRQDFNQRVGTALARIEGWTLSFREDFQDGLQIEKSVCRKFRLLCGLL